MCISIHCVYGQKDDEASILGSPSDNSAMECEAAQAPAPQIPAASTLPGSNATASTFGTKVGGWQVKSGPNPPEFVIG